MLHSSFLILLVVSIIPTLLVRAIRSGSDVDDATRYPFYVMLGNPHVCGGVLLSLNPAIVLTAAHCVADAPHPSTLGRKKNNPYFAAYNSVDRKKQLINPIADWIVHPKYQTANNVDMHHDLALVKLEDPLERSECVDRVALWPADAKLQSFNASLMGFGYMALDGKEASRMQFIDLKVTRMASGFTDMVEATSANDDQRACHGDSGSPLIIRQPVNGTSSTAPFVLGLLARIFGVHDVNAEHPTCPQPFKPDSPTPTITESFCNVSSMLDWISYATGLSIAQLTDPFHVPEPCYECTEGLWGPTRPTRHASKNNDDGGSRWHIGFGDTTFLKEQPDKWFIGPVVQDRFSHPGSGGGGGGGDGGDAASLASRNRSPILLLIVSLLTLFLFC